MTQPRKDSYDNWTPAEAARLRAIADGGDSPECTHGRKQLMYVGAALEEWWCLDCPAKLRVWGSSP